jgi:putative nucleotidyltransferase with HDIG domain
MHSVAVCALMFSLSRHLGQDAPQRRVAALAGLLHDIGKAFIPQRILGKPGKLTEAEFSVVRAHPQRGAELIAASGDLPAAVPDVAHRHHERPDGRGYPDGIAGSSLTLLARMGAVCDVYDAITSNRPYKDGWDPGAAMKLVLQGALQGQFDPVVAQAFAGLMGTYPIGSLVRLRSQRLGVVNASARDGSGSPRVTVFFCLRTEQAIEPRVVPLMPAPGGDEIQGSESNANWRFRDLDRLWAGEVAQEVYTPRPGVSLCVPNTNLEYPC